ncbi:E3 ubiquitin-protein ligase ring1a-like protein [Quillaja saponaria]|uniref:E3 ubiquitin-protein ligase ring1a-like protein n=1 Tax=Quillaja saponaria TaxID=32244 RepID=A0AAD7KYR2_QUISA|nr:E3 ubiquitin-protein ligase ring1a-like protein [Quillaja saponaria]
MPAQKRSLAESMDGEETSELYHQRHAKQSQRDLGVKDEEVEEEDDEVEVEEDEEEEEGGQQGQEQDREEKEAVEDSEGSPSSGPEDKPEFLFVELPEIRKDVQCPICLGIIKKTRTVMECLHRFCRECIDKSMRLGNNECPACRTHCASRRSLRDDPNYDALITALYPDIEKYEEQELEFHEEEKTRNKQIQASIAKIVQRQSEALVKKRVKDTAAAFVTGPQRNHRNVLSRRRGQGIDLQGSEDNEEEQDNNGEKDSSSTDDSSIKTRQRRQKRRTRLRSSQPSSSTNPNSGCMENNIDTSREKQGISPGLVSNPEMLAWGRGGARSHTRHGSTSGGNSKSSRSTRLSKLVDHLRSLEENNNELEVHLMLVSLDKETTPRLQQPHLSCRPTASVKHLCEYVARQTPLLAEEVEILAVKGVCTNHGDQSTGDLATLVVDPCKDELEILEGHETLAGLRPNCISRMEHLILAYRQKETT